FEPLVGTGTDFSLKPLLAKSWSQTDDKTWEIVLNDGILFHDNTPLTAKAVKFSLDHATSVNPKVKSMLKYASSEVVDDKTVKIHTTEANPLLPAFLHYPNMAIMSENSVDSSGTVTKPIGTGPMVFKSLDPQTKTLTMTKNDKYWKGQVQADGEIIKVIPDPNTRSAAIENGEYDITFNTPASEITQLKSKGLNVELYDTPRLLRMDCNMDHPQVADKAVRQAISYAIDRKGLVENVLFNAGTPAVGPYLTSSPWALSSLKPYAYDPEKAKSLLDEAGWKVGADGIRAKGDQKLELTLISSANDAILPSLSEAIAAELKEVGIKVNVELADYSATEKRMGDGNFDLHFMSFSTGMVPDPAYIMENWYLSTGGSNYARYKNPTVDQMIIEGAKNPDRARAYDGVQTILNDELPVIPIIYPKFTMVTGANVKGFVYDPTSHDYRINPETHIE
ncbi:MAG TPA: ABC transporter substrate-binding protein, partial [Methanospirillum sp.]|uniref:ABC transporter substrate-binding protein n=1 Tax=Methanospirillum sp. TaxID=45200 RepID=UPI002B738EF4